MPTISDTEPADRGCGAATFAEVREAARSQGLACRGGFHPEPRDAVPDLPDGRPVRTLILLGNAGPAMWDAFRAAGDALLDEWSRRVIDGLAAALGGHALFPFERPYLPFQRWACRAEPCFSSPLGILIHPDYGLWHGYRGALAFARRLDLPPGDGRANPCESCIERPCLSACPVAAFSPDGFDVSACAAHVGRPQGRDCLELGCRARRACPVGRTFRYRPAQAEFHMRSFERRHRPPRAAGAS